MTNADKIRVAMLRDLIESKHGDAFIAELMRDPAIRAKICEKIIDRLVSDQEFREKFMGKEPVQKTYAKEPNHDTGLSNRAASPGESCPTERQSDVEGSPDTQ